MLSSVILSPRCRCMSFSIRLPCPNQDIIAFSFSFASFSLLPFSLIIVVSSSFHPVQAKGKKKVLMHLTPSFFVAQEPAVIIIKKNIMHRGITIFLNQRRGYPCHLICSAPWSRLRLPRMVSVCFCLPTLRRLILPASQSTGLPQSGESRWKKKKKKGTHGQHYAATCN